MKTAACALALLALLATAPARTVTSEKLGVTLEVPDDWADSPAIARMARPPAELIAGVASPSTDRNFIAMAVALNPHEAALPENFKKGLRGSLESQGFTISETSKVTLNGVEFEVTTGTVAGQTVPRMHMLSTFGNGHAYTISASSAAGDPTQDAELQAIVQSFRFLAPPKQIPAVNSTYSAGYKAGQALGTFGVLAGGAIAVIALLACPAVLIVGGYFFLRKKK